MNQNPEEHVNNVRDVSERRIERTVKLKTGVTVTLKAVPPILLRDSIASLKEPKPPMVDIESKGRKEENPNDPDYLEALATYQEKRDSMATNGLLAFGIDKIDVPEGMQTIEDDEWIIEIESFTEIQINRIGKARKVAWLKYVGLTDGSDYEKIIKAITRLSGVSEEDVQDEMSSFRGPESGTADRELAPAGSNQGANHLNP